MNTNAKSGFNWKFGSMIVGGGFLALGLLVGGLCIVSYISAANYSNEQQVSLATIKSNNKNILATHYNKVQEIAQVPEMFKEDLYGLVEKQLQARYGENGSQAMFQWFQEQNLDLDREQYRKIQQVMEAGRNEFKNAQTDMLDRKREYTTQIGYLWRGFWIKRAGYPKINNSSTITVNGVTRRVTVEDLDKEYAPIIAESTQAIFDSGVDPGIKLRPKTN